MLRSAKFVGRIEAYLEELPKKAQENDVLASASN
jgi:hypothetical protein